MAVIRQSGRRWYRIALSLGLACLVYLYTGDLEDHKHFLLDHLPELPFDLIHRPKSVLLPLVLEPLPLGSIKPSGWLKDQMRLMGDGLAGHEFDFYKYVARSSWLGGDQEYSALNEAFPYWFNGLVPLAYGLDDDRLKAQVHTAAQYVLEHQHNDGWLGPEAMPDRLLWARFPLCLGMIQLAQANDTWTRPILHALHRFNKLLHEMLSDDGAGYLNQPAGDWSNHMMSWGRVRGADMILVLQWLLEHYPAGAARTLIANMQMLHQHGLQWEGWYSEAAYLGQGMHKDLLGVDNDATEANFHFMHGVNVAQGLKAPAVLRRLTRNDSLIETAHNAVNWTLTFHGAASGTILADERLVGLAAYSGSELCTSVELIVSLAYLYQALGVSFYADGAELATFNSLPAMFLPDWWSHQYVAAPNQPYAAYLPDQPFYNTNNWAQTFGLEPHYPCCTVNHPQGLPKFLSNSFAMYGRNGMAHILLSPGNVRTTLAAGRLSISATTAYPFDDDIHYSIKSEQPFDFFIRIPWWAEDQSFFVAGDQSPAPLQPDALTRLHHISVSSGQTNISVHLQSAIRVHNRADDTIAVYKGALLYALNVKNTNTSTGPRDFRHPEQFQHDSHAPAEVADHELYSAGQWNVAVDPSTLMWHNPRFSVPSELSHPVFHVDANVGYITAQACEIDWPMRSKNVPDHPPLREQRRCLDQHFEVKLIPYGSAKLHMADLPAIELKTESRHGL